MFEISLQYALFLAQAATVVAAFGAVVLIVVRASTRGMQPERLMVRDLGERVVRMRRTVEAAALSPRRFKLAEKARRRDAKARAKVSEPRRRVFVLGFRGDLRATGVASLRDEVTAVLAAANDGDEVLVRLDNAGGVMHDHGLAAAQLARFRTRSIPLTICVDKIAASGGYMMACVANQIVAAPFAVLGSIGVLAQVPNLNRLLEAHGIEFEQALGGEYKRTVTVFGKNTDADRDKLQSIVADLHCLFKEFVAEYRPSLDLDRVATGEHWPALRALELGLCDAIETSDDRLLALADEAQLLEVRVVRRQRLSTRMAHSVSSVTVALVDALRAVGQDRRVDAST